jgi:chitinase
VRYIKARQLGGIMFWQLSHDSDKDGLVETIYREKSVP